MVLDSLLNRLSVFLSGIIPNSNSRSNWSLSLSESQLQNTQLHKFTQEYQHEIFQERQEQAHFLQLQDISSRVIGQARINEIQTQISEAQSFLKENFNTNPPSPCRDRSCRFNPLPKGSVFAVNPYTGAPQFVGITFRGSQKTLDYYGAGRGINTQGILASFAQGFKQQAEIQNYISENQQKIGLIRQELSL